MNVNSRFCVWKFLFKDSKKNTNRAEQIIFSMLQFQHCIHGRIRATIRIRIFKKSDPGMAKKYPDSVNSKRYSLKCIMLREQSVGFLNAFVDFVFWTHIKRILTPPPPLHQPAQISEFSRIWFGYSSI